MADSAHLTARRMGPGPRSSCRRRFDARLGSEERETLPEERLRLQFNLAPENPIKQFSAPPRTNLDEEEEAGLPRERGSRRRVP